jgi:hypothetical protein
MMVYLHYPGDWYDGTYVEFVWPDNQNYMDKFLKFRNPNTFKVLYQNEYGRIIKEAIPAIYQQGIWIQDTQDFGLSYDLPNVRLERDRMQTDRYNVRSNASSVWRYCDSPETWREYFRACQDKHDEGEMYLGYVRHPDTLKEAFFDFFGPNAVVFTDDRAARLAEHHGRRPIMLGHGARSALSGIVKTDEQILEDMDNAERRLVPDEELASFAYETIEWLREMGRIVNYFGKTNAYELEKGMSGGFYHRANKEIGIDVRMLFDRTKALAVFIEELAHATFGTVDKTNEHEMAVLMTGAKLIQASNLALPDDEDRCPKATVSAGRNSG